MPFLRPDDQLARYGDEFAVLLPGCPEEDAVASRLCEAERIGRARTITAPARAGGVGPHVSP